MFFLSIGVGQRKRIFGVYFPELKHDSSSHVRSYSHTLRWLVHFLLFLDCWSPALVHIFKGFISTGMWTCIYIQFSSLKFLRGACYVTLKFEAMSQQIFERKCVTKVRRNEPFLIKIFTIENTNAGRRTAGSTLCSLTVPCYYLSVPSILTYHNQSNVR